MVKLNIKVGKDRKNFWQSFFNYFYKSVVPMIFGMISTYFMVVGFRTIGLICLVPAIFPLIFDLHAKT